MSEPNCRASYEQRKRQSDYERLHAIIEAMPPEEAKKGARMLWRLNDWLVDSHIGFVLPSEATVVLGDLIVKLQRQAGIRPGAKPHV